MFCCGAPHVSGHTLSTTLRLVHIRSAFIAKTPVHLSPASLACQGQASNDSQQYMRLPTALVARLEGSSVRIHSPHRCTSQPGILVTWVAVRISFSACYCLLSYLFLWHTRQASPAQTSNVEGSLLPSIHILRRNFPVIPATERIGGCLAVGTAPKLA
jgi:hypothetical protein